jgi:hypothetical protein
LSNGVTPDKDWLSIPAYGNELEFYLLSLLYGWKNYERGRIMFIQVHLGID